MQSNNHKERLVKRENAEERWIARKEKWMEIRGSISTVDIIGFVVNLSYTAIHYSTI